jgi:hypothetical protein
MNLGGPSSAGLADGLRAVFFGSSPNSGERGPDLEEEVGVVAEAVGHPFDHLDLVVDALDQVGAEWPVAVSQDSGQVWLQGKRNSEAVLTLTA